MVEEAPHIIHPLNGAVKLGGSDGKGGKGEGDEGERERKRDKTSNSWSSVTQPLPYVLGRQPSSVGVDGLVHEVPQQQASCGLFVGREPDVFEPVMTELVKITSTV